VGNRPRGRPHGWNQGVGVAEGTPPTTQRRASQRTKLTPRTGTQYRPLWRVAERTTHKCRQGDTIPPHEWGGFFVKVNKGWGGEAGIYRGRTLRAGFLLVAKRGWSGRRRGGKHKGWAKNSKKERGVRDCPGGCLVGANKPGGDTIQTWLRYSREEKSTQLSYCRKLRSVANIPVLREKQSKNKYQKTTTKGVD